MIFDNIKNQIGMAISAPFYEQIVFPLLKGGFTKIYFLHMTSRYVPDRVLKWLVCSPKFRVLTHAKCVYILGDPEVAANLYLNFRICICGDFWVTQYILLAKYFKVDMFSKTKSLPTLHYGSRGKRHIYTDI